MIIIVKDKFYVNQFWTKRVFAVKYFDVAAGLDSL